MRDDHSQTLRSRSKRPFLGVLSLVLALVGQVLGASPGSAASSAQATWTQLSPTTSPAACPSIEGVCHCWQCGQYRLKTPSV